MSATGSMLLELTMWVQSVLECGGAALGGKWEPAPAVCCFPMMLQ